MDQIIDLINKYGFPIVMAVGLGYIIKSIFYINLAHSNDWIQTHKNIISYIINCDENELPKPSTKFCKNSVYRKLLSLVKGNYYSRNGTISLNSKQKARASYGGDRDKNEFEDIILQADELSRMLYAMIKNLS